MRSIYKEVNVLPTVTAWHKIKWHTWWFTPGCAWCSLELFMEDWQEVLIGVHLVTALKETLRGLLK